MSGLVNPGLVTAGCMLAQPQSIPQTMTDNDSQLPLKIIPKTQESESESESETSSDDNDSSDEEKHMADNPVLKERLKQLDRYATPIHCSKISPVSNTDTNIPNTYCSVAPPDCTTNHASVLIRAKSGAPSEMADSSSTPSDYRCHQLSMMESPNGCSGPVSLNASITPKHFSPPYGIVPGTCNSDPLSQHDHTGHSDMYPKNLSNFNCGPGERCLAYSYGGHAQDPFGGQTCDKMQNAENDYGFSCETCHSMFSTRLSLQNHMKKHSSRVSKRHQCSHCPYSSQYAKNLLKHVESMHSAEEIDQFRCEGCCRCFATEDLLRNHECSLSQCNSYRCDDCGRVFKTKLRLKYHTDIHNPRKPYVCDVEGCDRAFRTPKYLKNHRDEFHRMQPKNYVCPVEGCDLIFHRKTHLKRHIATHDDAEKKYPCQWPNCQRRFCSEETLNLHYRKHTGEKPFNCALCVFSCYNKSSLNEHYRLQHAKDTNVEGPYKSLASNLISSTPPAVTPRLQSGSASFGSQFSSGTHQIRTSTPVPAVRHRMVDILESCGVQQPGPLDAEINGILDSLDKESDLPDLFSSGTFDFEHSNPDPHSFDNSAHPTSNSRFSSSFDHTALAASEPMTGMPEFSPHAEHSEGSDYSLSNLLLAVLAELQKADASGSVDEFERAKASAISILPAFSTGEKLAEQIDAITNNVLQTIADQPIHILKSIFHSSRCFTRDESYMIESLEHQLLTDSVLVSPTPPRRRGRRPKLQQQLQPYLERIFSLEPNTAEAMAAHLLSVAQVERNNSHYENIQLSNSGISRGRGRGRGCRFRGRTVGPLSLTLRLLPDGTAARTGHSAQINCRPSTGRGSMVTKRIRGVRGRYRIDRSSDVPTHAFTSAAEDSTRPNKLCESSAMRHLSSFSCFDESHLVGERAGFTQNTLFGQNNGQGDDAVNTSLQLRAMGRSSVESEEELDELEELDEPEEVGDGGCDMNDIRRNAILRHERSVSHNDQLDPNQTSSERVDNMGNDSQYQAGIKSTVSQDTLGEMLEDLGVIVKRIGERAAAKKQLGCQDSPISLQPHNHIDYAVEEQRTSNSTSSLAVGGGITRPIRMGNDAAVPAIQLPSMASLASASVGTPASGGGSTPGCPSNAELYAHSPHVSSVPSQHPTLPGPLGSTKSGTPMSEVNSAGLENRPSDVANLSVHQSEYKSPVSEYHRAAPMWSCESMCCPTTRDDCSGNVDDMGSPVCRAKTTFPRHSDIFMGGDGTDNAQSYRPTDLSTRMINLNACSAPPSPTSPRPDRSSPENETVCNSLKTTDLVSSYSAQLSSNAAAMGSLMSAVEAVDHLRSLSALGAKYTASLGIGDGVKHGYPYQSLRLPQHEYHQPGCSPPAPPSPEDAVSPDALRSSQPHTSDHFIPPNVPSALNNLLCRERKVDGPLSSSMGLSNSRASCGSPTKLNFLPQMNPGQTGGAYSSYQLSAIPSRCSNRGRNEMCNGATNGAVTSVSYPLAPASLTSTCSSASSSSSPSARTYLHELYQQREHQYHQHQPLQQTSQRNVKSPVHDLTTRQLLSEAAATAYAHGLGRCDGQNYMGGQPGPNTPQTNQQTGSPRINPYLHSPGAQFSLNQYQRYHPSEMGAYPHPGIHLDTSEHSFHTGGGFGHHNSSYIDQPDPYHLYQQQLRQSAHPHHSLQKSMEHIQPQTATHLAHSIHEVSGLAAAEAAAAAAYAYHQYHQQQAQRHGQVSAAHSHYQNLLSANQRAYYSNPVEEQFSPRDLALYTAHSDRRDPKSAYLAETYRGSQAAPERFLF